MRIVLYAILAYILFLFVFRLVIPVYLASRKIKRGFKDMQQKMQEQQGFNAGQGQQGFGTQASAPKQQTRPKSDDYIEFEEVK